MSPAPVVRFAGVGKRFPAPAGAVEVLRRIDLQVQPGDFVAITGPSGSGKSTLLHLAALLDRPTAGTVHFNGQAVSGLSEDALSALRKTGVGMVFQKYCLLPHRSVLDNVLFRFRYVDHDRRAARNRALEALDVVGMGRLADRQARLLSGGEMQRVAIARAVALRPKLLVADEPTGNLDSAASRVVMDSLERLNREGLTILLVTHNEALLGYCSRQLRCEQGMLREAA